MTGNHEKVVGVGGEKRGGREERGGTKKGVVSILSRIILEYYMRYCSFIGTIVPFYYCFTHKITPVNAGNKWLTCGGLKVN